MSVSALGDPELDILFRRARTQQGWAERTVSEVQLREIHALMKFGPTSFNAQPARLVFCSSGESRRRLAGCASKSNAAKILLAPVTVIIGWDPQFYELLPALSPRPHVGKMIEMYRKEPGLAREHALRNSSLQGAYFIIAARALGLDCGPMSGFDNAKVDAEFFAATGYRSNFICSIGYGDPVGLAPREPRLEFERACVIL